MKKIKLLVLAAALLPALVNSAQAVLVLPPGSTWEYTFTDPTGNANWSTTTGGWSSGAAPFGNQNNPFGTQDQIDFSFNTLWPADNSLNDDLWVRTTIDLTGYNLSTALWDLGVDNGYNLYVNGALISGANAEGFTTRWEYSGAFGNSLVAGVNVLALALEDHGGLTAFDMQVTADARNVPDTGGTFALMGLGLCAMRLVMKKRAS